MAVGDAFVGTFFQVLVHDELRTAVNTTGGYIRLLLRDFVVGQEWTGRQLEMLANGVARAGRAERHLAAFQKMVDAENLFAAARAVADYYSDDETVRVSIANGLAEVPVPFATLPFALWLFVHHQPGIKLAATTDNPPPYVALEVNLSDSEIQVSVEPTRSRGTWSDETVRAAHSMGWISGIVRDGGGFKGQVWHLH